MASPTVVATTATSSHAAAGSFDLQVPAHQAGDIILMHVVNDDNDGLPGWSEGWELVPGTVADVASGTHSELRFLVATGSNHTCTVTYGSDPGQMWAAGASLRDFDGADPWAGVSFIEGSPSGVFTPDSNSTTVCSFIGVYGPAAVDYSTGAGAAWTTQEGGSHTSGWAHGGIATLQQTTAAEVSASWDATGYNEALFFVAVKGPVDDQTAPTVAIDAPIHGTGAAESITDSLSLIHI